VRRQLALLVAATTCLVLIAFLVPVALLLRTVAESEAMSRANFRVQAITPLVGDGASADSLEQSLAAAPGLSVFPPSGPVLGAPAPRTDAVRLATAQKRALTVDTAEGLEIVTPVVGTDGVSVVRIVVPRSDLTRGVTTAWLALTGLGVALVLLGLLVADRLARSIVAPISELSAVSHRLARAELTARARPAGPPELREVAGALNHLAGRIQDLLREEREHVADLSHRLRTPLTALRLEAESLADPQEAERLTAAADGIERAVTAVIQQARRRGAGRPDPACDATAVLRDRLAFWSVLAEDTNREVRQTLPPTKLPVALPADDLAATLDALLGNVFAHTPDGVALAVELRPRAGGGATLTVSDAGPGFPTLPAAPDSAADDAGAGALSRGASGSGSTGLGLDIARRAAETGGGRLVLGAGPDGGALVRLELAAPT
jgi:signal transduction histidine kinase